MREIKFRAWIPKSYSGLSLMFYQNDQYLQSFLRRCVFFSNSEGKEHEKYGKYELMQFTGLFDNKDRREIYEGDRVKGTYQRGIKKGKSRLGTIVWHNEDASFKVRFDDEPNSFYSLLYSRILFEVIGNIYENPF